MIGNHEWRSETMKNARILVVDDDCTARMLVVHALEKIGLWADTAENGEQAVTLNSERSYELMIIDYLMPGMNGVEVFRKASRDRRGLRGIFLTAHANINTVYPAIEAGVERVLAKPFDAVELTRLVTEMLNQPPADDATRAPTSS